MRIVHLSTRDQHGGAARAAHRLHQGLRRLGHDSRMLVRNRLGDDPTVIEIEEPAAADARALHRARREEIARDFRAYAGSRPAGLERFSDDRTGWGEQILDMTPECDVLTLHWVSGLVDHGATLQPLAARAPVVWHLHDLNPMTGGCHYDRGCGAFDAGCGSCPQLGSDDPHDLSREIWDRKRKLAGEIPQGRLHFVAPSRWLAREHLRGLWRDFPVHCIPNAVDTRAFAPRDRAGARRALGIDPGARVVLFVSSTLDNERKGVRFLLRALAGLRDLDGLLLVTAGHGELPGEPEARHLRLGRVEEEERLATVYSAADVLAIPSLQENLALTALEAQSCGTPVVGFEAGGIPDVVEPGANGALAPVGDATALGRALRDVLTAGERLETMRAEARRRALRDYDLEAQAARHARLYEELIGA